VTPRSNAWSTLVAATGLLLACKADPPARREAGGSSSPSPSVGTPSSGLAWPKLDDVRVLRVQEKPEGHAIATWCIDAHDAVGRITRALERDGWTDIHTRGRRDRVGIAASRGATRFSATAGGRDERCAGTLVTATILELGELTLPVIERGGGEIEERIR
jgi:hypothetical protein